MQPIPPLPPTLPSPIQSTTDLIVLCGLSGAGKTVAARALEDVGYYCIDHLPAAALLSTLLALQSQGVTRIAIGLEMSDPEFLRNAQTHWDELTAQGFLSRVIVLTCRQDVLLRRYHETRRPHPLSRQGLSTESAIALESRALRNIPRGTHIVDTSEMTSLMLTKWVQQYVDESRAGLTLVLQSFGFKNGIPNDTDMMFDARCLPNPYYNTELRSLTGQDAAVIDYFLQLPIMKDFGDHIATFLTTWKGVYEADHRKYLNVGIGCTGGQHRSVYLAETLSRIAELGNVKVRHRDAHHWPANRLTSTTSNY